MGLVVLANGQLDFLKYCIEYHCDEMGPLCEAKFENAIKEGSYSKSGERTKVFNEYRETYLNEYLKHKKNKL